ncbi:hypothetical protein H0H92_012997 [Tricholoma furcatifolium]|nr:hypothetical protein H0H92_012997 [Tricholoma furcatifolium]
MPWFLLVASWVAQVSATHIAARQDSSTALLVFVGISDLQLSTCAPASIFWAYSGPDDSLSLFVSNVGVPQDATTTSSSSSPTSTNRASSRSLHRRDDVDILVASDISPTLGNLNITALAVPPGVYEVVAVVASSPPYLTDSSYFTVQQGTDSSCLTASSSSSLSPSSTSSLPATSSSSSVTSSDATSASSSPNVPVDAASSTPDNTGAIAGGVVAGAVVLIAAAALYCFIARKRRRRHARAPSAAFSQSSRDFAAGARVSEGRWGGLGSVDNHGLSSDPKPHGGARRPPSDGNRLSRSGSYRGYAGSPTDEKFAGSPTDEMVLTTLPYRHSSSNSPPINNNGRTHSTSSTTPSESPHRYSQQARRSLDHSASYAQSPFATPPDTSPLSAATVARTPSNGANAPRKTARKPVPAYADSSSPSAVSPPTSPFPATTPFADPVPPTFPAPALASSGHYQTRAERESLKSVASKKSRSSKSKLRDQEKGGSNGSSANTSSENVVQPELAHKSSFGPGGVEGKPLHYLIPDMPIRQ